LGLWDNKSFDQVAYIRRYAQRSSEGKSGTQVSATPLVFSMEPTRIFGSFDVEKIMIFDASPNSIPPALPLPSIPSVSEYDERSVKGDCQRPWTLTFSPPLVEKIQVVVRDLGFNALADVERAVPLMLAAFPEAHMLEMQVINYTDSIVSVHLSS
jgi:hypothetical protein